jgi:predicted Fe-Mo cluster-binding NifX family protein
MATIQNNSKNTQLVAIPVSDRRLCMHFGHCEWFVFFEVDTAGKEILSSRRVAPPLHQPGVLPRWLNSEGVNLVIAGGMGQRAQNLFAERGVRVLVGAPAEPAEGIVRNYLQGALELGQNVCDH